MKSLFRILLTIISFMSVVFVASHAQARTSSNPFYIEPYAGYYIGDMEGDGVYNGKISSLYGGARLGIELSNGFIIGVDYGMGKGDFDPNASGVEDGDYEVSDLGAFLGYRINTTFRIYGSYIFKHETKYEGNGLSDTEVEGDGFNAGISVKAAANVTLGLEHQVRFLKEYSGGSELVGSNNKSSTYLLTLKLPIPIPSSFK